MKLTQVFILLMLVSVVAFDVFIIGTQGKTESISAYLIRWSHEYPSVPFLFGFVAGHLFWKIKDSDVWGKR